MAATSAIRSSITATLVTVGSQVSRNSTHFSSRAWPATWVCTSVSPGITHRPFRSMTVAPASTAAATAASVPTATIVEPRTAIADAMSSPVNSGRMRPLR